MKYYPLKLFLKNCNSKQIDIVKIMKADGFGSGETYLVAHEEPDRTYVGLVEVKDTLALGKALVFDAGGYLVCTNLD